MGSNKSAMRDFTRKPMQKKHWLNNAVGGSVAFSKLKYQVMRNDGILLKA